MTYITTGLAAAPYLDNTAPRLIGSFGQNVCRDRLQGIPSRFPCCVLLALSWNTSKNPSTDKLSRAINKGIPHFIAKHLAYQQQSETQYLML